MTPTATRGYLVRVVPTRLIALGLLCAVAIGAELAPDEWKRVRREAAQLTRKPGELDRKFRLIDDLARETGRTCRAVGAR